MRAMACLLGLAMLVQSMGCTLLEDNFIPDEVYTFLTDADLDEVNSLGMPIYVGSDPPITTGTYYLDSLAIVYDDEGATGPIGTYYLQIGDSGFDYQVSLCEYTTDSTSSSCAVQAYVSGNGDCFTIYAYNAGRSGNCEHDDVSIYSGCFDYYGDLIGLQNAYYTTAQAGNCANRTPIGHLRIIEEMDGVSEWIE
jgi:hypothetical protein